MAAPEDPVFAVLDLIRPRPGMYIGKASARALFQFLNGYIAALRDHTALGFTEWHAFVEVLYGRYGYGGGGESWARVLGRAAGGDAAGLDLFYAELDAFRRRADAVPSAAADRRGTTAFPGS